MKRRLYFFLSICFLLFTRCTLSGEQEDQLNRQLMKYMDAYNDNNTLQLVALTHPAVVRFYKEHGDTIFLSSFHQKEADDSRTYYDNSLNRETKSLGKSIQRKFWVEKYTETEEINPEYCIFALSEDGGNTWFFINQDDYFNSKIKIRKRLFAKH
jgi:hypothetical protein